MKKTLFIIMSLGIVAGIILFLNISLFSQIRRKVTSNDTLNLVNRSKPRPTISLETFLYKADGRDPFGGYEQRKETTAVQKSQELAVKLRGIVLNREGGIAMLEDATGNIFFMRKNDKQNGLVLKELSPKGIVLYLYGRRIELKVIE